MGKVHRFNRGAVHASVGMSALVAGSIALILGPTPAHAADRTGNLAPGTRPHLPTWNANPVELRRPIQTAATSHVVVPGDTVSAIAARYGLRTADILALNGLTWRSVIYPQQVIRLIGTAPAAPTAPPAQTPNSTYTVHSGDTVYAIAGRHGVSTASIIAANGLPASATIFPGQTLTIPGSAAQPATPPPASTASTNSTYTIVAGDTMIRIAERHGMSVKALLAANGLEWGSIIYPGQTLTVPAPGSPSAEPSAQPAALTAEKLTPLPAPTVALDGEQIANVASVIRIGRELGVPERGIAIALAAAMQESWLRNLDWGDRDSLGLFQQRPSAGWGTPEQVRDVDRAIRTFFGGPSGPNKAEPRGLLDIPGWQQMSFTDAAQAVQVSAYPERYGRWEAQANTWLTTWG